MNLAIVHVLLKSYCKPFLAELEMCADTPEGILECVRNSASDDGNEEIVQICDWIESKGLAETFFPVPEQDPAPRASDWTKQGGGK